MLKQESLSNSRLVYVSEIQAKPLAYNIYLCCILVLMALLPFVKLTIGVKGKGVIQSEMATMEIVAPISGQVLQSNLRDNKKVSKGDTLLVIDDASLQQETKLLAEQKDFLLNQLKDIDHLIKAVKSKSIEKPQQLLTRIYAASWQRYSGELKLAETARKEALLDYKRHERLYAKKVISRVEWERHRFNYEQAKLTQEMVGKKFISQSLTEADGHRNELMDIKRQKIHLYEREKKHVLNAVVNGSIQNLVGIQSGTYVSANQKLGEISPDSSILAICYVKSSDIAFIKKGQAVRFQIDAFQYTQWGFLHGKVVEISDDVIVQHEVSYFKIKCRLAKQHLQLKGGYKGHVKKGMTLLASFTIAKRKLYQVLLDKRRDWL